jgi:HlyD family secretion protein
MGQTVAASFQTPTLFLIATDLTKMQVDTNVSESDIGTIKEANKAVFTVDAFPKRTFNGTVIQVRQSPQTVQNVVTFDVVIGADNSDLAMKPGMTAATRIVTDERNDVVRVPNQALRYRPSARTGAANRQSEGRPTKPAAGESSQAQLWVLRDGQLVLIPVVVGLDDDSFTEIVQGEVKPGDQVITGEQSTAADNRTVAPRLRL